jgi:hypothetical protein
MVLAVDEKIHEIEDNVELKVMGRSSAVDYRKSEGSAVRRRGAGAARLDFDV